MENFTVCCSLRIGSKHTISCRLGSVHGLTGLCTHLVRAFLLYYFWVGLIQVSPLSLYCPNENSSLPALDFRSELKMETDEDAVKKTQLVEARARNISHNVRCIECGSQSIEDSQADIAILLRKLIRDEIRSGKTDKEIYKKLENEYGETILYTPKFDLQTAALWLSPVLVAGAAAGVWAYSKHKQKSNVHIMALNLVRGVPLTPKEKQTMLSLLSPPPPQRTTSSWWRSWRRQ
ncbi:unnamed protein product [Citrullus colocynthis]|uniref:Cytochrome c-type biogenesis protein n=1 Tax=Citrullus colocynthis TaxID=252529 RepID=A0ABP0YQW1_9ROSI